MCKFWFLLDLESLQNCISPKLHKDTSKLSNKKIFSKDYILFGAIFTRSQIVFARGLFLSAKVANFTLCKLLKTPNMKRFLLLLSLSLLLSGVSRAENVIIGEKIPDMDIDKWLMDIQPTQTDYTCILFYHSESELCRKCLKRIKHIVMNNPQLNLIILSKEKYGDAGVALTEHLEDRIGVAFDDNGRTFRYFGVKFIPFCVIVDKKSRAKWCGNALTLEEKITDKITSKR